MSWIKVFFISIVTLIIEVFFVILLPDQWYQEDNYIVFFAFYQLALIPSALFLYLKKLETFSITCILLLFVNLFMPSNLTSNDFKTLPKNYTKKLIVRGDVMPNFEGINTISTDEKGFRSLSEIDYSNDTTFRIFAIGGSTTEEIFVDDKETWTSLLEIGLTSSQNKTIEVVNTGVSGLRAQHHLAMMLETEKYHPDAYIFLMGVNDWNKHIRDNYPNPSSKFFPLIRLTDTLIWKGLGAAKDLVKGPILSEVSEEYGQYYSRQNNSLEKDDSRSFIPNVIDPHYESAVNRIAARCNESLYLCLFLSQPSAYSTQLTADLKKRLWMTPPNTEYTLDLTSLIGIANLYNNELRKISANNAIHFCDIANEIPPTTEYFYDDVHFNEKGSAKVANVLLECLIPILKF
jgi:lysophospholipase L1-like esterase